MRTTVVPAQITTVEDRIIGSLTFTQVLMLMVPLITSTVSYVCLAPRLHATSAKLLFITIQFLFFGLLSMRVNGRILAEWLAIFLRFSLRPKLFVFTKNDPATRNVRMFAEEEEAEGQAEKIYERVRSVQPAVGMPERQRISRLLTGSTVSVRFKFTKKGILNVSLKPYES